jgi:hypothetical protein
MTAVLEQRHFRAIAPALRPSIQYKRKTLGMDGGGRQRPELNFSKRAKAARATSLEGEAGESAGDCDEKESSILIFMRGLVLSPV